MRKNKKKKIDISNKCAGWFKENIYKTYTPEEFIEFFKQLKPKDKIKILSNFEPKEIEVVKDITVNL